MIRPILTPQQRRVLEYVAEGLTGPSPCMMQDKDLAARMGLSPHTVSLHLRGAYDALRDHCDADRAAAAYAAARLGLIHAPGLTRVPSRRRRAAAQAESLELV